MLWDRPAELYPAETASTTTDYCMDGKAGADVVAKPYARAAGGDPA